jgi:peptidoglycan/xylan/chitin deacetylase (PgdA/CDA1 family)
MKCVFIFILLVAFSTVHAQETTVTRWQDDKPAAISLTFDDGSRNQFTVAMPMLDKLKIPATFYIITGDVSQSKYHGKFIGRPIEEIIKGTADTPTNKENFFERASAIGFTGYKGALAFHTDAGTMFEGGKIEEAHRLIDSGYKMIRSGQLRKSSPKTGGEFLTWPNIKKYAANGHEFASHTVTHPRLAVLTEPNILWELEKSKEEIADKLGERYTFSAECPYGTEDERVMEYALRIYPSLRNRMPENYLGELNRASKEQPGTIKKEYVQWQRGATTKTPLTLMKSWVDTVAAHNNNWLVLVFHGVDGVGWEALSGDLLQEYFNYIKKNENKLWIATFADATKYMREKMNSSVTTMQDKDKIVVEVTHTLDKSQYDIPLTLRTYVPSTWQTVTIKQGADSKTPQVLKDDKGSYILYRAKPNAGVVEITGK